MSLLLRDLAVSLSDDPFGAWCADVSPSFPWGLRHLVYLRERLARVTAGDLKRLMIFLPPRSYKSECVTVRYSLYRLTQDPALNIAICAYSQALANRFSRKARRLAEGRIPLAEDRAAVEEWETLEGGGIRAVGVGSGITGTGADLICIDDPIRGREEADSEAYRDRVWDWYTDDISTRQEPGAAIILTMTRWHEDDLAGRLLKEAAEGGEQWEVVSLPAEAEEDDPLGREVGQPLTEGRFGRAWLEVQKRLLGREYYALYQQRPTPLTGDLLEVAKIGHAAPDRAGLTVYQAWDLAISERATADYTACATVGVDADQNAYLLDLCRGRWSFGKTLDQMAAQAGTWNPTSIAIETTGYQSAAFQEASRRYMLPFREVRPDKDKVTRAQLLASRISMRKFFADRRAPWWRDFEAEATLFPQGRHDDQVDAVVHALALAVQPRTMETDDEMHDIFFRREQGGEWARG